jgi:hypothetical protein
MLSVTNKAFMLNIVMLSVIYAECHKKAFMLSVALLSVVMLSVVAPY